MNNAVTFFVGCLTFVLVMLLKIPVKKFNWQLAVRKGEEDCMSRYKRYNIVLFPLVAGVSLGIYYGVYRVLELDHFKLCCTLKAAAVAVAFYAVYEQWMGSSSQEREA